MLRAITRKRTRHALPSCAERRRALPPLTLLPRSPRRAVDFAPRSNFVVRELVDGLTVCCRFGVREGAAGAWEPAPLGNGATLSFVCPRVLRLDAVAAHEAACDYARAPCPYAGCGALLRSSEVAAHDAHAAGAHAVAERAERVAAQDSAKELQRRLDKLAPHALHRLEEWMDSDNPYNDGAFDVVLELMTLHASNAAVTHKCCDALVMYTQCVLDEEGVIAGSDDMEYLLREGAVEALVAALRTHGAHAPDVSEKACEALANMMEDVNAAHKAAQQGVVAALLAALAAHEHNVCMQQEGLRLMSSLITPAGVDDAPMMPDMAAVVGALKDGGAMARIFAAMRLHSSHASVQQWAVKALWGLQPLDAASSATAVASLVTVLPAILTYVDTDILSLGFSLLCSCVTASNTSAGAAAALAGVIVYCLRFYPGDVSLQQHGVAALALFCTIGYAPAVLNSGAAAAAAAGTAATISVAAVIAAVMGAHPAAHELQRAGFRVLTSLATLGADGALAASGATCVACIMAAMKARSADAETQRLGAHALSCIFFSTALALRGGAAVAVDAAVTAEAVAVLAAALDAFGDTDAALASTALRAFWCLHPHAPPAVTGDCVTDVLSVFNMPFGRDENGVSLSVVALALGGRYSAAAIRDAVERLINDGAARCAGAVRCLLCCC
jgi:hypothetical protein